ncbi:MAG TPA: tRNA uridine-5-carboxymethylaminomethyl(34) synthesis enzyme MnmG, partial [Balneolaceae bacterium]|nr:tRNA uridine-5-carboxymethylaminomethyl(34) synthesis enzyme MnmG [Balneolaceae bacterium]
ACQGLMAGINAALKVQGKDEFILKRSEAYIGVLIDDLINKGTEEPYRMFTSRAEHRILLRQDNADLRLTELGYKIGLADEERYNKFRIKKEAIDKLNDLFQNYTVRPENMDAMLKKQGTTPLSQPVKAYTVLTRPEIGINDIIDADKELKSLVDGITQDKFVKEQVEIQVKYSGYIQKEFEMVKELSEKENTRIPESMDYSRIKSLSTEGFQKLSKIKPETIGQASRISGVSASDVSVLLVYLKS